MRWSFVMVQILIIAVMSYESFPIDLKEIDKEDIYLVDQLRKGRFIQVNQTTFIPNPMELLRAKKSSKQNVEKLEPAGVLLHESFKKAKQKAATHEVNLPTTYRQMTAQNNYSYADSLFERQIFGHPFFFQDQFKVAGHIPHFSNPMFQMSTDDNCCNFNKFMGALTSGFPCCEQYIVPEENLLC